MRRRVRSTRQQRSSSTTSSRSRAPRGAGLEFWPLSMMLVKVISFFCYFLMVGFVSRSLKRCVVSPGGWEDDWREFCCGPDEGN